MDHFRIVGLMGRYQIVDQMDDCQIDLIVQIGQIGLMDRYRIVGLMGRYLVVDVCLVAGLIDLIDRIGLIDQMGYYRIS
jgi:hypothetical protein